MIESHKTAKNQLIELIHQLKEDYQFLSLNDLFSVLNASKTICTNDRFIEVLINSIKTLKNRTINDQNSLTKREREVLCFIGNGLQNIDIALKLNLSKSTIETHRKNIRRKLNLNSNDSLYIIALISSLQSKNKTISSP